MYYMFLVRKYWGCYIVINLPLFDREKSRFLSKQKDTTTTSCIWSCFHCVRVWKYRGGRGPWKKKYGVPYPKMDQYPFPIGSMYDIFISFYIYISLICMINVGRYTSPMDPMGLPFPFFWNGLFVFLFQVLEKRWAADPVINGVVSTV